MSAGTVHKVFWCLAVFTILAAVGCGSSSSSSSSSSSGTSTTGSNNIVTSGNNVAPLIVDAGPAGSTNAQANVAYTTMTICAPGSSNCVTIDHVAVDTGSTGLRVPASLLSSLNLANVNSSTPLAECVQFLDTSFMWGSVRVADVKMGGTNNDSEVASSVPLMVMGDPDLPSGSSIPGTCATTTTVGGSSVTGTEEDSVAALGANGILGVGNYKYDCDVLGYSNPCTSANSVPDGTYYQCSGGACSKAAAPLAHQVRNPVTLFAKDNNGVIMEMPSVAVGGVSGISSGEASLVFGIGTESNNTLASSATVLELDSTPSSLSWLGFTTVYNGVSYPYSTSAYGSFIDSGSTAVFFLDEPTTGITVCSSGLYCPSSTLNLSAVNKSVNGHSSNVTFNVSNGDGLSRANTAFSDMGAPNTTGTPNTSTQAADGFFDWGLPFFYGRNVYVGVWGMTPPNSSVPKGPFWAY